MQSLRTYFKQLFVSPDEPRLRAGWRLILHSLLIEFIAIIVFLLYNWVIHFVSREIITELPSIAVLQLIAITLATWIARRFLDRRTFRSLGFKWDAHSFHDLAFGFAVPALLMGSVFVFEWGVGWLRIDSVMWKETSSTTFITITSAFMTFIAIGFYEELLFRGYRLQNLIEGLNLTWALIISSAIFALQHLFNPHSSLTSTLGIFAAGFFMAYGWVRTGRLWLSIGLHIGWNFFEGAVFGFPVSGLIFPGVIHQTNVGPVVITGGSFGPEAGLVMLPMIAIGVALIWAYTGGKRSPRGWERSTEG
jgi:membrane protease YdiL (CAAX protease family)